MSDTGATQPGDYIRDQGDEHDEEFFVDEPTLTEWRADRVGNPTRPQDMGPGDWDATEFTHVDKEIVEHWVLHQKMRVPGVLYEIYEIKIKLDTVL